MSTQIKDILELSVSERVQLVEDIWDSISQTPKELPLSTAEKMELNKRLKNYENNPNEGIEWETLKKNLSQKG